MEAKPTISTLYSYIFDNILYYNDDKCYDILEAYLKVINK